MKQATLEPPGARYTVRLDRPADTARGKGTRPRGAVCGGRRWRGPASPRRAGLPPGGEGDLDVVALHPDRLGGVGRRHRALDGLHARRPTERRQLGAGPAGGPGGQLRQPARGLGEAGWGVAVENRQPPPAIRDRDGNVGIEAPRPPDGRVNRRQPVGRRQHDDLTARVEAVEQDEELGDQLRLMGRVPPVAPAGQRIEFIDENDRRLVHAGPREDLPEMGLTAPHPLGENLRSADDLQVRRGFGCHRLRQ